MQRLTCSLQPSTWLHSSGWKLGVLPPPHHSICSTKNDSGRKRSFQSESAEANENNCFMEKWVNIFSELVFKTKPKRNQTLSSLVLMLVACPSALFLFVCSEPACQSLMEITGDVCELTHMHTKMQTARRSHSTV